MQLTPEEIPGYSYGTPSVSSSRISMQEFRKPQDRCWIH